MNISESIPKRIKEKKRVLIRNEVISPLITKDGDSTGSIVAPDWTKAPNSYIFDPSRSSEGLYVPVKKAYAMWETGLYMGGTSIPVGNVTAEVLWEDVPGLIKSGTGYSLELVGIGQEAKIKVPVNKSKEGNAVIVYKVNNSIYWSWHIWVTDDPTNGPKYKSFDALKRERSNGTVELIPDSDWGWMDRNLGAVGNTITGTEWNRNGGLLYQWGRKDPIPPLVFRGNDFYEVSGSIGRVRHIGSRNFTNAIKIDDLKKFILLSNAEVSNNIRTSVQNPLSLIYVNKDDNSGAAYYNDNVNLPVNWFGKSAIYKDNRLTELNLWSDNSQGIISENYNNDISARPYRAKSSYDPCPNGWRIPSMLVANLASSTYIDDIRIDFSPFGVRTKLGKSEFESNDYYEIKPTDNNVPAYMTGFKVYPNFGYDLSKVGSYDMGIFPGTGQLIRNVHSGQYTDQHHTCLWTATMAKHFDETPATVARTLFMIPDKDQPIVPDSAFPDVKGMYKYMPTTGMGTSDANGCRCIKDPLYVVDNYNFPTEYLDPIVEYKEGINNPNTYQVVKSSQLTTIEIPVSKAFSVQSQLLNNSAILNSSSYNNLKPNVLWTTNTNLINKISITNPFPSSFSELTASKIVVEIKANQSGSAVVTLHNESITNPVYWSWHIWVTDTPIDSYLYTTEQPVAGVTNYINYVNKADVVLQTEFMDRNLGATDAFPIVANPLTPTTAELAKIRASTGFHYQWGRKDPMPSFQYADNRASYNIYLGTVAANGTVSYTTLTPSVYNDMSGSYIVPYNTYVNSANANILSTDKISEKAAKVIGYSVKKPLVYMIPSNFSAYNSAAPNSTNGTDWISTEPNIMAERWGRGGQKSPFDPCPEGWRIPDVIGVAIVANKDFGLIPWYKKDKNIATSYSIASDYQGVRVRNPSTTSTIGYTFNNANYKIGNYPNSGSRGFRSIIGNQTGQGTYNVINFQYPGVWMAALTSNYIGRSVNMLFDAASNANREIAFSDNNDPYFGMSCRCAKIKYDASGNEEGVIPKSNVSTMVISDLDKGSDSRIADVQLEETKIQLFPNPVKDWLYLKAPDKEDYSYKVYNMSGQLVLSDKFFNGKTNISSLVSGIYLVQINESNKVIKIMKQ
ncbi:T9SS type A sorting domain-containing protein [Chryseobacterium sp.]|uniref:T9SS type A sorting domain-containing protein n=1 Tax=Chryseobacterium sp. TaxID=1871047 RepID=UPI0025BF4D47|nr:T9SS type A sorting domain-containing protein [Chryseobacterium sp.]